MRELTQKSSCISTFAWWRSCTLLSSFPAPRTCIFHRRLCLIEQAPALGEPTLPGGGDLKAASAPPTSQSGVFPLAATIPPKSPHSDLVCLDTFPHRQARRRVLQRPSPQFGVRTPSDLALPLARPQASRTRGLARPGLAQAVVALSLSLNLRHLEVLNNYLYIAFPLVSAQVSPTFSHNL